MNIFMVETCIILLYIQGDSKLLSEYVIMYMEKNISKRPGMIDNKLLIISKLIDVLYHYIVMLQEIR
jgi:hypothetical protein